MVLQQLQEAQKCPCQRHRQSSATPLVSPAGNFELAFYKPNGPGCSNDTGLVGQSSGLLVVEFMGLLCR